MGSLNRSVSLSNLVMADRNDWYQFQMNAPGNAATNPSYTLIVAPGVAVTSPPTPTPPPIPTPTPTTGAFEIDVTMRGLTVSQQAILQGAVERWEQVNLGAADPFRPG